MGALTETGAQEGAVNGQQDPAPTLEEDGRQEEAGPQRNLEARDDGHRRVIVLLDEIADGVGERVRVVLRLATRRGGALGGRDDGRDDSGASVGREVEDRVDAVGEHGDRVLGREKPDQGHHYNGNPCQSNSTINGQRGHDHEVQKPRGLMTHVGTEHSRRQSG